MIAFFFLSLSSFFFQESDGGAGGVSRGPEAFRAKRGAFG